MADYFITNRYDKTKYDKFTLYIQPAYRWSGIISFLVGGTFGYIFEYVYRLPGDFPSGIAALVIAIVVYVIAYRLSADQEMDRKLVESVQIEYSKN